MNTESFDGLNKADRTLVMVDNFYLYNLGGFLGKRIDIAKLRDFFKENCDLHLFSIYACLKKTETDSRSSGSPFHDWLRLNNFTTTVEYFESTNAEDEEDRAVQSLQAKNNAKMIIETVVLAHQGKIDHFVLFASNSLWIPVVEHLKALGIKTTMVAVNLTSDERAKGAFRYSEHLRRACHYFWDIETIIGDTARDDDSDEDNHGQAHPLRTNAA